VVEVDRRRGAVILADGVARRRVAVAAQVFGEGRRLGRARRLALAVDVLAQEEFGVGADHPFRQWFRLDQEEPPEVAGGEVLVGAGVHRRRRRDVDHGDARHRLGMVQRHAVRHPAAAVVAGDAEAVMAQQPHQRDLVGRQRQEPYLFC